jgi:phenylacetate-CoA ligase
VAHRAWSTARGSRLYVYRDLWVGQYQSTIPADTTARGLSALLRHAVTNVPFYRESVDFDPASLPIEDDPFAALASFPLLDKTMVRDLGDRLFSADLAGRGWIQNSSGGSTGTPVIVIQDKDYLDRVRAFESLAFRALGLERGDPFFILWGSMRDLQAHGGDLQRRLRRLATNIVTVNAFGMSDETMRSALAYLDRRRPKLILAYAQALYELARFAERNNISVRPQQAVATSANTLHPFMRDTIARVFGCPVYNDYGCREAGSIAVAVPGHEGLWINPWNIHVEVVDAAGAPAEDGVEGEILVTSLANYSMPLIRYRIGDRGLFAPRGTGPHPEASRVLEHVSGRVSDVFRLKDGKVVPGYFFVHLLGVESPSRARPWVRRFQVVQKEEDLIVFRIILEDPDYPRDEWERVKADVRTVCGDCRVELEIVDHIPLLPSGKFPYTVNEVSETG